MWKRVAIVAVFIAVPVGVAWLVQSYATGGGRSTPAALENPPVMTHSSGRMDATTFDKTVETLLRRSAEAWNGGRLDAFMMWYAKGAETTFIGASGLVHGREEISARYASSFEPEAERDSLRFTEIESRLLAPGLGLATARYVLHAEDSVTATGLFTLVLEETAEGWRIVHDHSSADPN
jgi:uncharacterized protein (TIGR02246 family)